jgi:Ca-activated chloride channel family protein
MLVVICMPMHIYSFFDYDRAIGWAQLNLWSDAGKVLNGLVAQEPDNPELVYDAGVVAFNNEDYQQAKTYFESAAQNDRAPKALKSQAYFNKGNTHVALQELKEALLSYEQTLMLNPEDQQAKHNYETVKKMLEQQEQQEQQQNDQKSDKQSKKDQQKDQNKQQQKNRQEQDKNQQSSDDKNDASNEQQDDLDDSQTDDEKENEEHENGEEEGLDQERDQEDKQEDGTDQEEDKSQKDKERNESGDFNQEPKSNEEQCEQQKKSKHESPSDKNEMEQQQQNKQGEQKEQEIGQEEEELADITLDPRLERVLEKRSDRDAQLNKQMVKALVSQDMKGRHGQNCW